MSERQHASDTERFMHQDYNGLKNQRFTKPNRNFTWRREPDAVDHTTKAVATDPAAGSVVKDPPARHYYRFGAQGTPQYDYGPLVYPPYEYGASGGPSYGYGTHLYPSHGSGGRYHRSYDSRDQYPRSYDSRNDYYHSYGSRDHYPHSYGSKGHYPDSLGSTSHYSHGVGNSDPLSYGVAGHGHLPYSHDNAARDLPSHGSGVDDFHAYGVEAKAPSPKFPAVSVCGLPSNCSEVDIIQFFGGLHIVDVILIFIGKTFSGKAVVVFSNATVVDSALQRNKQKLGDAFVEIDTCRRQDYYDAVAGAGNDGVDFGNKIPKAESPNDKNMMEHTCDPNGNVVADSNYYVSPPGQAMRLNGSNVVNHFHDQRSDAVAYSKFHERPEAEPENPIKIDYAKHTDCHDRIKLTGPGSHSQTTSKGSSNKDQKVYTQILKLCNVPPSADKYEVIEFFDGFNLTLDRLQVVCCQNGIATGEVYVEFDSVEDAKKAISKDKKMILTQCVELFPSSPYEASRAMSGSW